MVFFLIISNQQLSGKAACRSGNLTVHQVVRIIFLTGFRHHLAEAVTDTDTRIIIICYYKVSPPLHRVSEKSSTLHLAP